MTGSRTNPASPRSWLALAATFCFAAVPAGALELPDIDSLDAMRSTAVRSEVRVDAIDLRGPAALRGAVRQKHLAPYIGRRLSPRELTELRDVLTARLIKVGYVTSGARIPVDALEENRLTVELVAGRLDSVVIEGVEHFATGRLEKRIEGKKDAPLNMKTLERRLQWIANEPLVERLTARLEPGLNPGEAVLYVELIERRPERAQLQLSNDVVPNVGSEHMRFVLGHDNLLGYRDSLEAYLGKSPGLDEWKVRYALPVNRFDTVLFASYRDSRSQIVHSDLDLDLIRLESRSRTLSIGVEQPFQLGRRSELRLAIRGDLRRAQSRVNDFGFFLAPGEDEQGKVRASVLRVIQGVTFQRVNRVFSARSTVSIGIDVFDASDGAISLGEDTPDGTFVAWLGQAYAAWRLPARYGRVEVASRLDIQVADDPMLAMERVAIGGQRTVRGYVENTVVRDNGAAASVEFRLPLLHERARGWSLQLVPFVDAGVAWNHAEPHRREWLASVGLGLSTRWRQNFRFDLQWGGRLIEVEDVPERGLQKHGFHIAAELRI